jgi:uncharacterized NAD(P)/FAD-binding protein YdhS
MKLGIIGAGPRGLLLLNNLLQNLPTKTSNIIIHLFDRSQAGGRVWKVNQPIELIMNTPANELTLFNDNQPNALSMAEWAQSSLAIPFIKTLKVPNQTDLLTSITKINDQSYVPRAIFGTYCQWFYQSLCQKINHQDSISLISHFNTNVQQVNKTPDGHFQITTAKQKVTVDKLAFSLGQQENQLNATQKSLQKYAQQCNLTYILPGEADETDLSSIKANQTVIIRGMGLSFNDYVARLTTGRGGYFTNDGNGTLTYHPSGKEPHIYAGSRRGVPYYPKAISQKQATESYEAVFLTSQNLQAVTNKGKIDFHDLQRLLRLDIEYRYYSLLIATKHPQINLQNFQQQFIETNNHQHLIQQYNLPQNEIWNWDLILNPVAGLKITTLEDYQKHLTTWLEQITEDAILGSKTGPITGALEMLRDLRNNIRDVLANHLLSNDDLIKYYYGEFSSNVKFLSMGAPVVRSQELLALMRAGLVTILGPQMQVIGGNHHFITRSAFYGNEIIQGDALIEARTNAPNTNISANPVIKSMMDNGIIQSEKITLNDNSNVNGPSININDYFDQVKDEPNLYTWGLNTEGHYFVTSAIPRPGVNDAILLSAEKISRSLLGLSVDNTTRYM